MFSILLNQGGPPKVLVIMTTLNDLSVSYKPKYQYADTNITPYKASLRGARAQMKPLKYIIIFCKLRQVFGGGSVNDCQS